MTNSAFRGMVWRGRAWFLPFMMVLFLAAMIMWSIGLREWAPISLVCSLIPVGLCFYLRQKISQRINPHDREIILKNLEGDWHIELVYQHLIFSREKEEGGRVAHCWDMVNYRRRRSSICESDMRFTGPFMENELISRKIYLKRRVCRNGSLILDTLGSIVKVGKWNKNHLYTFGKGTIHIKWSKGENKLYMQLSDFHEEVEKCPHENNHNYGSTHASNGKNESDDNAVLNWKEKGEVRIKLKQEGAEPEVLMMKLSNQAKLEIEIDHI